MHYRCKFRCKFRCNNNWIWNASNYIQDGSKYESKAGSTDKKIEQDLGRKCSAWKGFGS